MSEHKAQEQAVGLALDAMRLVLGVSLQNYSVEEVVAFFNHRAQAALKEGRDE